MKQMKKWLALCLALTLLVSLAACGGEKAAQTPGPETSEAPAPEAEGSTAPDASPAPAEDSGVDLAVSLTASPVALDPAYGAIYQDDTVLSCLYEGLMVWTDSGKSAEKGLNAAKLDCGAAERYDRTENGDGTVTYTFHLRPEAKWSDGKAVTAGDFVYAWKRLFPTATAAELLSCVVNAPEILAGEKQPEELAVQAVDERTFAVTVRDVPWFLELCAMPAAAPVRQDVAAENNDWSFEAETCLTNGPYKLKSWESQSVLELERNGAYRDAKDGGADTITFYFVSDNDTTVSAFSRGTLDAAVGAGDAEAPRVATLTSYYLCFQTQKAPFDDVRVRRAFALAVDRAKIAGEVVPGQTPAGALVPDGVYGADGAEGKDFRTAGGDYIDPAKEAFQGNCDKARALLTEAGYPGGAGLPEVEYLYPNSPTHKAVAEALRDTWQTELGVAVSLRAENWGKFLTDCAQGEFSIARGRWAADYNDPISFLALWTEGAEGNYARYAGTRYDALMTLAAGLSSGKLRMERLQQAEEVLINEDSVLAPVYFETRPYLLSDKVSGVCRTPRGVLCFGGCVKE